MVFMEGPPRIGGNPGEPVPEVDPDDVKAVWQLQREVQERHPGKLVAVAGTRISSVCRPGADMQAVGYRVALLNVFIHVCEEGDFMPPLLRDGNVPDSVFREVAQMKAEWIGSDVREGFPFDADALLQIARGDDVG